MALASGSSEPAALYAPRGVGSSKEGRAVSSTENLPPIHFRPPDVTLCFSLSTPRFSEGPTGSFSRQSPLPPVFATLIPARILSSQLWQVLCSSLTLSPSSSSLYMEIRWGTILLKSHQRIPIAESNFSSLPWSLDPHDEPLPASLSSALAPTQASLSPHGCAHNFFLF